MSNRFSASFAFQLVPAFFSDAGVSSIPKDGVQKKSVCLPRHHVGKYMTETDKMKSRSRMFGSFLFLSAREFAIYCSG